jgi:hypothetical protein
VIAAFVCYLQLARTRAVNSDGADQALQAWDMLHGNLLLHSWLLGDVSYYTTEVPQYMLVELIRGLNADVVHVAAAMTYTLATLLAALLAKGNSTGRQALVRVLIAVGIMLAPQLVSGVNILLSSPDHIGTSVPVMVVWLILDHARPRWYIPVIAGAFLGWAVVADMLVLYIGVLPLALVCAIRVYRAVAVEREPVASQRYDLALAAAALVGAAAGVLALRVIHAHGGFYMPAPNAQFIQSGPALFHNLAVTFEGLLLLGGADFLGLRPTASAAFIMLHVVGVCLAAGGTWLAARRFLRDRDLVAQLLVDGRGHQLGRLRAQHQGQCGLADPRDRTRAAVQRGPGRTAAGRAAQSGQADAAAARRVGRLPGRPGARGQQAAGSRAEPAAHLLAAGPASAHRPVRLLGVEHRHADQRRPGPDPASETARRTARRQQLRGEGELVRPRPEYGQLRRARPRRRRVSRLHQRAAVLATFGQPARTYHVGSDTILVWNKNLLSELR